MTITVVVSPWAALCVLVFLGGLMAVVARVYYEGYCSGHDTAHDLYCDDEECGRDHGGEDSEPEADPGYPSLWRALRYLLRGR